MGGVALFLQAVRAPSLTAAAMPVLCVTALLFHQGHAISWLWFALTLLGMLAAQAAVNLINDYFDDDSGLDADPEFADNPFPLGSRVIQTGALDRRGVLRYALACGGVALVCGLVLNAAQPGNAVLWVAASAAALGYFYTAPPLRIAYHGAGEPVTFLLFGPLAGIGTAWVQTGRIDGTVLLVSTLVGWLAMAILFMHHFPQHAADRRHGKKTPIVRLGPAAAGRLVPLLLAVPYALLALALVAGWLPVTSALFFLSAPFAFASARIALARADRPGPMTRAFALVMGQHLSGGLLLAVGLLLG